MNAAARTLDQGNWFRGNIKTITISRESFGVVVLVMAVLLSALAVVYIRNLDRSLFSQLQSLQTQKNELQVEFSQLMLEESTWTTPARIQKGARSMQMKVPAPKEVVLVKS